MSPELIYLLLGGSLLLAAVLPRVLHRWALSAPMVLVATGMLVGLLPAWDAVVLDPVAARPVIEHVTELTVLVALMGVGLALDRPLRWCSRESWRSWSPAWRLLGIAMPLTIAGVALLAWGPLGVAAPATVLLGAALAPTDPVLASDVQVEGPTLEGAVDEIDEDDEVRFALTSEAGLNDGLAFPFVYAAIFLASVGSVSQWWAGWLAWELVGKVVVGVLVGLEQTYDTVLSGSSGKRLVRYIAGGVAVPVEDDYRVEPENGKDIVTTIDTRMQEIAENALMKMMLQSESASGTCVVMETATGKIKAIANLGAKPDGSYWEDYNYALRSTEPGSTIKLATLLSVLSEGRYGVNDMVEVGSSGSAFVGVRNVNDADIKYRWKN